ncbi:MAG: hypothetical protein JWR45_2957 [Blastococcus sp.]|jgi:hypothetical protein|nr:hypothetical protein [Blastococcus sp.]
MQNDTSSPEGGRSWQAGTAPARTLHRPRAGFAVAGTPSAIGGAAAQVVGIGSGP